MPPRQRRPATDQPQGDDTEIRLQGIASSSNSDPSAAEISPRSEDANDRRKPRELTTAEAARAESALNHIVGGLSNRARAKFDVNPQVVILGFGKSGKSRLFNAIYGRDVQRVSCRTDQTSDFESIEICNIRLTDSPGFGTSKFDVDDVFPLSDAIAGLSSTRVVIHVLNGCSAITRQDAELQRRLHDTGVPAVVVVNKADLLKDSERDEFADSVERLFGLVPLVEGMEHEFSPDRHFLFVSAETREGIEGLTEAVYRLLPSKYRGAFAAQQNANMSMKYIHARSMIYSTAAVAAGVAAAPVPFVDLVVVTPMQLLMIMGIGRLFTLQLEPADAFNVLTTVGGHIGLRLVQREVVKVMPGVGTAVSSALAFAGTVAFGETALFVFTKCRSAGMTVTAFLSSPERVSLLREYHAAQTELAPQYSKFALFKDRLREAWTTACARLQQRGSRPSLSSSSFLSARTSSSKGRLQRLGSQTCCHSPVKPKMRSCSTTTRSKG